jgi:hypothetical protein
MTPQQLAEHEELVARSPGSCRPATKRVCAWWIVARSSTSSASSFTSRFGSSSPDLTLSSLSSAAMAASNRPASSADRIAMVRIEWPPEHPDRAMHTTMKSARARRWGELAVIAR